VGRKEEEEELVRGQLKNSSFLIDHEELSRKMFLDMSSNPSPQEDFLLLLLSDSNLPTGGFHFR